MLAVVEVVKHSVEDRKVAVVRRNSSLALDNLAVVVVMAVARRNSSLALDIPAVVVGHVENNAASAACSYQTSCVVAWLAASILNFLQENEKMEKERKEKD